MTEWLSTHTAKRWSWLSCCPAHFKLYLVHFSLMNDFYFPLEFAVFFQSIYLFWPCYMACGMLVLQLGIKPIFGVEPRSLNHWTSREVPSGHICKDSLLTRMSPFLSYTKGTAASAHVLGTSQVCPLIWGFWFDITGVFLDLSKLGSTSICSPWMAP